MDTITNRRQQKIAVYPHFPSTPSLGLVFIQHGFSGYADQVQIQTMAQSFLNQSYTVILFDGTHSFGESDGDLIGCTAKTHYHDLEDVIQWAENQKWYQEPFILAGCSLGGLSSLIYATTYLKKIKALAPISTVISFLLTEKAHIENDKDGWEEFKKIKTKHKTSKSKPSASGIISWDLYESIKEYDLLKDIQKIKCPILLVVGDEDTSTPLSHHKILFEAIQSRKEIHTIKGSGHTFREEPELIQLQNILKDWIKRL